jgi:hypothetical protein
MKKRKLKKSDCSISSFQSIKKKSEKYWRKVDLLEGWGFQIQDMKYYKQLILLFTTFSPVMHLPKQKRLVKLIH